MTPNQPLAGNTFVVTGSSSGIGKAIAIELATAGADLVIHGRSRSAHLIEVAEEIEKIGRTATVLLADFEDSNSLAPFVDDAFEAAQNITCWINNAGGDVLTNAWKDRPIEQKLEYLWKTDVASTLLLSRSAGQRMIDQSRDNAKVEDHKSHIKPSIITIGWDQAWQGMAGESGELFATTKGAIMSMTKSLAHSLAPFVRVNCIAPGWIKTKWGASTSEYWDNRAKSESLMNRWGRAEDIAKTAVFLSSGDSDFISGQIVPVNGGFQHWQP